jgi:uncharacterized protein YkwD
MGQITILLFTLLFGACSERAPAPVEVTRAPSQVEAPVEGQGYLDLLDRHRRSLSLAPLIRHPDLHRIALHHSEAMAAKTIPFGHSGSGLRCTEARHILGGGNLCGEVVATGQTSDSGVLNSWLSSPGHRAQLENLRYTHTGMGFATDHRGVRYWTQIFLEIR